MTSDRRVRGVVLIGGSARGTVEEVVRALPAVDAAVFLACDVDATRLAALRRWSPLPIVDARDGAPLETGQLYVVPVRNEVRLAGARLLVEPANGEPATVLADRFLHTLADGLACATIAVILPGPPYDLELAHGIRRIKEKGGLVIRLVAERTGEPRDDDASPTRADLVIPVSELPTRLAALARRAPEAAPLDDPRTQTIRELQRELHRTRAQLEASNDARSDLEDLMTSTDIAVLVVDRQLALTRFTPRAQELLDVNATDLGRPLADLTHRLDFHDLAAAATAVLRSRRTFEREVRAADGHRFLARLLPHRAAAAHDRIDGVVLTFVDVTDLRTADDAQRAAQSVLRPSDGHFRLALRSAPLVALTQDADLRCVWGYVLGREVDVTGKTDLDFFGPAQAERLAPIKREILATGAGVRVEVPMTIDGVERTFDFRIEPAEDHGVITGLRAIGFDITPSKVAETALRDADARKDQLLATISHELRAPLAPLRAALDIQRLAPADPDRVARSQAIMERQIDHLVRLVDDLLDVSRLTENKITLDRQLVDVADVFRAAVEAVTPMVDQERHTLVVTPPASPVSVVGDHTRLVQILVNLLTNAIKYTPRGGVVELTGSSDARTGQVSVVVRDNGIGISPELLPRVFDLFVQGEDVAGKSSGGLGIGLNLVRRLVELHGGSASAHSDGVGCGAEMRVVLPIAAAAAAAAAT